MTDASSLSLHNPYYTNHPLQCSIIFTHFHSKQELPLFLINVNIFSLFSRIHFAFSFHSKADFPSTNYSQKTFHHGVHEGYYFCPVMKRRRTSMYPSCLFAFFLAALWRRKPSKTYASPSSQGSYY